MSSRTSSNRGATAASASERNAFISPSVAAKVRLGNRTTPRGGSSSNAATPTSSRRQSPRQFDHEIMEQLSNSTAVSLSKSASAVDNDNNIVTKLSEGAMQFIAQSSSWSPRNDTHPTRNAPINVHDDDDDDTTNTLDLEHNDNSFHVLASLLVEFFQDRITDSTIVLLPEDKLALERLLPATAVVPFIRAVQYRLQHTPVVPVTPLDHLALECQKLGLDVLLDDDTNVPNPILVAESLTDTPQTIPILVAPKQHNNNATDETMREDGSEQDGFVIMDVADQPPPPSSSSSSGVPVASSEEIADEMDNGDHPDTTILHTEQVEYQHPEGTTAVLEDPAAATNRASNAMFAPERTTENKKTIQVETVSEEDSINARNEITNAAKEKIGKAVHPQQQPSHTLVDQIQSSAESMFSGLKKSVGDMTLLSPGTTAAKASESASKPTTETSIYTSGAVATSRADATIGQASINTSQAIAEQQPKQQQQPLNPFLMPFASFMDRAPATPPKAQENYVVAPTGDPLSGPPPSSNRKPLPAAATSYHTTTTTLRPDTRPSGTIQSEQTAREQLLDELEEAENMLQISVTPETSNFWRTHRDMLASRLATLDPHGNNNNTTTATSALASEHLPDTIPAGGATHSRTFSEVTPQGSLPPNLLTANSPTGSVGAGEALVDVVAPANLPGGYQFEAEIEGKRFLAVVPPSGVQQGETFTCGMRELDSGSSDIPVGQWKDGLYELCKFGCCHPVAWNSLFCPLIALGQIQTRIELDFLGRPLFGSTSVSNQFMMASLVTVWGLTNVGLFVACNLKWSHGLELSVADIVAIALMNGVMIAFLVFVTQSTRNSLREKFMIREERCSDLEDICLSLACLPCTVGQMARHTANYDEYEAVCCSNTGLPDGVCMTTHPHDLCASHGAYKQDGYVV